MRAATALLLITAISLLAVFGRPAAGQEPPATPITAYREYVLKDDAAERKDGAVRVTFLGTTTLLFDNGQTQLIIDGFLSRPSFKQVTTEEIATDMTAVDAALQ